MAVTIKIARKNRQRPLVSLSFCIRFPLGATMDFNDHKSSLDLSCSGESSVEFVTECVDTTEGQTGKTAHRLSCILSDSEESLPKQRRHSRSIPRLLTVLLAYPALSLSGSCRQSNSSQIVGVVVDVVASNCFSHGEFKSNHFTEERFL